ncbi:MAG: RNase adapter RapZ [Tissierellia bacterium]|nr:RNase adapter RapZ [Tissierellia bacterium]
MKVVIITGMSGAGKSSALNILEDMGYYSMDNLPPILIMSFVELTSRSDVVVDRLAVGLDIRGMGFLSTLSKTVSDLKLAGFEVTVLFLDASDSVLVKRYKELRRPHPMQEKGASLVEGIHSEREALAEIRKDANYFLDTSSLKLAQLRERMREIFDPEGSDGKLVISIVSFGYKHGILLDGDIIFDVRFIPNPFYNERLKPLTGLDEPVREYVFSYEVTQIFLEKLVDLVRYTIPFYEKEGKQNLVIGIGCTGGKHRSVAIAQELYHRLKDIHDLVFVSNRDDRMWNNEYNKS